MNILFIMTDQQRLDYLSIYGHKVLQTPAMDRIGREGTKFQNVFVQSAVCGPSRACFYTGRYPHTNRSLWNEVPLPITERTMGHYFEEAGYRAAVIGKTHMYSEFPKPSFVRQDCSSTDRRNLSRMDSVGFEYITGAAATPSVPNYDFIEYLKAKGYPGKGQDVANRTSRPTLGKDEPGTDECRQPAAVRKEDSSVHYLTDRAIEFMKETEDRPWFLHLSYFRPHHPNYAPSPYNTMYDENDFDPPVRSKGELKHSLFKGFREERNEGKGDVFDELYCRHWRAVYAGLIKEIDDNLLRLFEFIDQKGIMEETMIIFTSDHGEMAADHWFFEKEMCYWQAHQVPLLIRHPKYLGGRTVDRIVESVDILPTCLEASELPIDAGIQGKSLMPFIYGKEPDKWREFTVAEWTFEYYNAGSSLGLSPQQCRAIMLRNRNFSYCHFNALPNLLFDLQNDPNELCNVADKPEYSKVVEELKTRLLDWQLETWDPLPIRLNTGWPKAMKSDIDIENVPYNFSRFM